VRATIAVKHGAAGGAQRAVTELQGSYQIAVVNKDDKVEIAGQGRSARRHDVGDRDGLAAGEKVVPTGVQKVRDGVPVKPVPSSRLRRV